MDALRNVSSQSLILQKPGGGNVHLLPGRAVTLTPEELQAPQVVSMLKRGLVEIEPLQPPAQPERTSPRPERRRASEPAPPK